MYSNKVIRSRELDSDGDEVGDPTSSLPNLPNLEGYTVWYSLEVAVKPSPPLTTISVICPIGKTVAIEVPVTNPGDSTIPLGVDVVGDGLDGRTSVEMRPREIVQYELKFTPQTIGKRTGR